MTLILLVVGLLKKRLLDAGSPAGRANDLMAGPGPAADPAAVAPEDRQLTLVERDHVGAVGEAPRSRWRTGHRPRDSPFDRLPLGIICGHGATLTGRLSRLAAAALRRVAG